MSGPRQSPPDEPLGGALDSEPAPATGELESLLHHYGRHLHVLAFHLTGDAPSAERLAQDALIRRCLRPDPGRGRSEAPIQLYLDLIRLWRDLPRRGRRCPPGVEGRAAGPRTGLGPLHRALASLAPGDRVAHVLRAGEGLDYEEIATILELPAETVRSRLQSARARLLAQMTSIRFDRGWEKAMNLYLDGRLAGPDREALEKHLERDRALRGAVEFHRGLTLEYQEEAPRLPRDFAATAERRLEEARVTGWPGAASGGARRRWLPVLGAGGLAAALGLVGGVMLLRAPQGPGAPPPSIEGPGTEAAGNPDEETVEALRALGYLAAGESAGSAASRTAAGVAPRAARPKVQRPPAPAAAAPAATAPASAATAPARAARDAEITPPPAGALPPSVPESEVTPPAGEPGPPVIGPAPAPDGVPPAGAGTGPTGPRPDPDGPATVPLPKGPDPGRDHQVLRSAAEWIAFVGDAGGPPPEIDFATTMIVVLRNHLHNDPPGRLAVVSVTPGTDAIEILCRVEPPPDGERAGQGPPPGQALILPASDVPIRVVMR
jgi:DNA-directed RNA polymerase specialized sigma24 family protein